ncbi:energy transducer TonB [Burkholderia sp. BCC0322]|uniref:energy transducer TonB n=1 Tax=unclassified Burkholderia TaxID=2613784 RepID=UPI001589CC38|nr:energy transducer TonB [Burkholderia sp. BCC0322]
MKLKMAVAVLGMMFHIGAHAGELGYSGRVAVADGACRFPAPVYPVTARQSGHKGRVVIGFTVKESGAVVDIGVSVSSGYEDLDNAAVQSIENMICEPLKGGKDVQRKQPFDFSIS